jgi:hypothetical protein
MAVKRYAKAIVERRNVDFSEWMEELRDQHEGAVPKDFVHRTAKTILRKCDPKQYLLSHATIVASVDTYAPKGVKTGRLMNRGCQIDVRWPEFRIKPECHNIINNNGDAWERSLLLSTYRTFIGAHNYLEHIQLPELSKGFIVDAIARDLGSSCYIDILVATDRKHNQLVSDILSGAITGLSMGCISLFTACTKCGNVAADDAQLCPCVLYDGKLSTFIDETGREQILAEIIGHVSVPNSNQFIEASWVRNPAFRGAVRRNILNPDASAISSQMQASKYVYELRQQIPEMDGIKKAASIQRRAQQGQDEQSFDDVFGGQDQGGGQQSGGQDQGGSGQDQGQGAGQQGGADQAEEQGTQSNNDQSKDSKDAGKPAEPKPDKIDGMLDKITEQLLTSITNKLEEKLAPKPEDVGTVNPTPANLEAGNDSLVHSSQDFSRIVRKKFGSSPRLVQWAERAYKIVHEGGVSAIRRANMSPRELIILSWIEDRCRGRFYPPSLYKAAMQAGPSSSYPTTNSFLAACKMKVGRELTAQERRFLEWKGQIASISF